ncbi:NUDIX domain-containing protein [Paracoccus tegillarcae]|uniref:NUDIX hydrolase n=1 Tax=Paracoccus tegillarcae TaxID=1529068 RepID=A0A2K9EE99_9RHOB|nr:NUDIX hydrolase [Paracoccus tegillarcae]
MIPRYGQPPVTGRHYRARPGAYGLLLRRGQVLLTLQAGPEPDMQLPGGGIDPGESPIHALHREVFEETGWAIASPRRIGAYRRYAWLPEYGYWAEKICTIWLAEPVVRRGDPVEPDHRAVWVPLADLPAALSEPGARAFVTRLMKGGFLAQASRRHPDKAMSPTRRDRHGGVLSRR